MSNHTTHMVMTMIFPARAMKDQTRSRTDIPKVRRCGRW